MAKLSILLPIYNGAISLPNCIESILSQSYEDFELLCIDDGSLDNSYEVCKEYARKDERIVLLQKENGGVASARNLGLKRASGVFLTCIDQDDWLEHDMYLEVISSMVEAGADMGVCGFFKDKNGQSHTMKNNYKVDPLITDINDYVKYAFYREYYRNFAAYVWNKVFSLDLIRKNNIQFDQHLRRGDDVLFYIEYALKSKKCVYRSENYYHYAINDQSVSNTKTADNIVVLADILKGYSIAISELEKDIRLKKESIDYLKCFYSYHASQLYQVAKTEGLTDKMHFFRGHIELYLSEYIKQNAGKNDRIDEIMAMLNS